MVQLHQVGAPGRQPTKQKELIVWFPYNELSLQRPPSQSNPNCKDNVFSLPFSSTTATFKPDWPGCDNYIFLVLPTVCCI